MHDDYESRLRMSAPANLNAECAPVRSVLFLPLDDCQRAVLNRNAETGDFVIRAVNYPQLDETLLSKHRPEVVVAPLFSEAFDIVDVAETLSFAGYFGELWVVGPALPNPALIAREIREFAGNLVLRIITDPASSQVASGH